MSEETRTQAVDQSQAVSAELQNGATSGPAEWSFPSEAYSCPHCGQMLGSSVRVCVACRQPIDPKQIKMPAAAPPALRTMPLKGSGAAPENAPKVRFPWSLFLVVLLGVLVLSAASQAKFGMSRTLYAFGFAELLTSLWVVFDAHAKGIPQPLQWGLGTMLLWPMIFPWYLARRRQREAACPFVESGGRSLLRIVLLWLLINLLCILMFGPMLSSLSK